MEDSLRTFIERSPVSEKVKLSGKVILQRTLLSPLDIVDIKKSGKYGPVPDKEQICELEIGQQLLAKGKIIKKKGEYYFKVTRSFI